MSLRLSRVRTALLLCRSTTNTTTTTITSTTASLLHRHHNTPGTTSSSPAATSTSPPPHASSPPAATSPRRRRCHPRKPGEPPQQRKPPPPPPPQQQELPRDHPTALARRIDRAGRGRPTRTTPPLRELVVECLACPLLHRVPADAAEARQLMDLLFSVFRVADHAASDAALAVTVHRATKTAAAGALGIGARPPAPACAPLRARLALLRALDAAAAHPPPDELRAVLVAAPAPERDRADVLSLGGLASLRIVLAQTTSEALAHLAAWDALVRADGEGERLLTAFPRDRLALRFEAAAGSALDPLEHALVRCRDHGEAGVAETLLARAGTTDFLPALAVHPRHCAVVLDAFAAAGDLEGLRRTRGRLLRAERVFGVAPQNAEAGMLGYVRACLRAGSDAALREALETAAHGHRWRAEAFAGYAAEAEAELEARAREA
eukprot:Rhum_TRINITY_DN14735_c0_g1::Rhum_TRINITY_DN14735_c0_g1_i1::g.112410::m.112410